MVENARKSGLPAKQERAIEALLSEPTVRRAAEVSKVAEVTLRRWRKEPHFEAALSKARDEAFSEGLRAIKSAAGRAVQTLVEILDSDEAKPSEKVTAARSILELGFKASEILDLEERLRRLEAIGGKLL